MLKDDATDKYEKKHQQYKQYSNATIVSQTSPAATVKGKSGKERQAI